MKEEKTTPPDVEDAAKQHLITETGGQDELWEEVINQIYDWHYDYGGSENGKRATENYMKSKYILTHKK